MLTSLRIAIVVLFVFPALTAGQEKIVLQPKYPVGEFWLKSTQEDVSYDSFAQSLFHYHSTPPKKSRTEREMIIQNSPPNAEGAVRTEFQYTKYKIVSESEDKAAELTAEERDERLQSQTENDNYSRILCDSKMWMLVNPELRQVLEVHGFDENNDRLLETTSLPALKNAYQSARGFFGDEKVRESAEFNLQADPGRPVSVGDQWTAPQIIPLPILLKAELEIVNTLKEIKTDSEGRKIAVIESHSEWNCDEPRKYGPWKVEYLRVDVEFDSATELEVESGLEICAEKRIRVLVKRWVEYDDGPCWVVTLTKRTETATTERIEEKP